MRAASTPSSDGADLGNWAGWMLILHKLPSRYPGATVAGG